MDINAYNHKVVRGLALMTGMVRAGGTRIAGRSVELGPPAVGPFVAAVLVVTVAAGGSWLAAAPERAFDVVLALLLIACPCALSLAARAPYAIALGRLARLGLPLSSARMLERFADVDLWLLDKTGTLTDGRLGIGYVRQPGSAANSDPHLPLRIAAALEAGIDHPIARAFTESAPHPPLATNVRYRPGYGVTGRIAGVEYALGSARFVGVPPDHAAPSTVYLAAGGDLIAQIALVDRLRSTARAAVAMLARSADVVLVSGDEPVAVEQVAMELNVPRALARHAPADKLRVLDEAQAHGRVVAAVGGGVDDALLLARADLSIALASSSRLTRAGADATLVGDDLRVLAGLPALAAATRRIVRQNLALTAAHNLIALPLAAASVLTPWMAAVGLCASSLVVVANALRLHHDSSPRRVAAPTRTSRRLRTHAAR